MGEYPIKAARIAAGVLLLLSVSHLEAADPAPDSPWGPAERERGYGVFLPGTVERLKGPEPPGRESIVRGKVSLELARRERESLQIGIHGLAAGVKNLRLEVQSDLAAAVYCAHPGTVYPDHLKNDWVQPGYFAPFSTLMPGNVIEEVPRGQSRSFWITFHAGPDTAPGTHRGKLRITGEHGASGVSHATELDLEVRVRPFVLRAPRAAFGMYFRRDWIPARSRGIEWQRAIYKDMADHGQNSVTFYEGGDFSTLPPATSSMVRDLLPAAKQAGLTTPNVPCMALQCNIIALAHEQQTKAVEWLTTRGQESGWPEIVHYGHDEPRYPNPDLRKRYAPFRQTPMRLITAMSAPAAYGLGDFHDVWVVYGGHITPEMRADTATTPGSIPGPINWAETGSGPITGSRGGGPLTPHRSQPFPGNAGATESTTTAISICSRTAWGWTRTIRWPSRPVNGSRT